MGPAATATIDISGALGYDSPPRPMDVTCNRCGTDYEFEETLVSTRGTTVKCTSCGHLFKVFRGGNQEHTATDDVRPWLVRRRNGDVEPLVSLGDLTRMIARNEITPDDDISRSGQAWKKLGDIAELQGFFGNPKRAQAALSATPPLGLESPVGRPRRTSEPSLPIGVTSQPPVSRTEITETGPEPTDPKPTDPELRISEPPANIPTPRSSVRPRAPRPTEPTRSERPKPRITVDEPPSAQEHTPHERPSARQRAQARKARGESDREVSSRSSVPPSTPSSASNAPRSSSAPQAPSGSARPSASSHAPLPPPRPTPGGQAPAPLAATTPSKPTADPKFPWSRVLLLIALVGIGMGMGAYAWGRRLVPAPVKVDPAAPFLARADAALATHDLRQFSDAVTDYTKALAFNERDAVALTRISRTHAVWAEALENLAQWEPMRALDARAERKRHMVSSRNNAELALRAKPDDLEAEVALADALRLEGNIVAAREHLTRAHEPSARSSAESLRVASLLAHDESDGDLSQALQLAARAVEADPRMIRTQLLAGSLLLAANDLSAARERARQILSQHPSHKLAVLLLSVIEAKAVAASATSGAQATPTPTPPTETTQAQTAIEPGETEEASNADGKPTPAMPELPTGYDDLIRRGESLLERGSVRVAKEAFQRALALRPGSPPALTGLGYIALERGDTAGAIRHFTPASVAGFGDALIGLGDTYRRLGRNEDALSAYERYLNRFPNGPRASIAGRQAERLREEFGRGNATTRRGTVAPSSPEFNDVGARPR